MKGALGECVFQVAQDQASRLISSMQWSGSINMETHNIHGHSSATEYTGQNPDEIELTIVFAQELGTIPMEEMTRLWTYMRKAEAVSLTVGTHAYGRYRWTITSLDNNLMYFDRDGDVRWCEVTVHLQEYLREVVQ